LVSERAESGLPDRLQKVAGLLSPHDIGSQHGGAREKSDQSFELPPVAVGYRRTNGDVFNAGEAVKDELPGCQQDHVWSRSSGLAEIANPGVVDRSHAVR